MPESPSRRYYTISETAEMLDVKPHVLRYWESQFPRLRPRKNRGGIRMYQEHDIDLLRTIREMLYERGYTISGAKKKLNEERRSGAAGEKSQIDIDFLTPKDRKQLRHIRDELASLRNRLLAGPAQGVTARVAPRSRMAGGEKSVDHAGLQG